MVQLDRSSGRFTGARFVPSPNVDARPDGCAIDAIVLHNISLPPGQFGGGHVDALFTNTLDPAAHPYFEQIEGLRVSAHLLIDREGGLTQFAALHDRAWHAGTSSLAGRERCNDFSIGIELEGTDDVPFSDAQYAMLTSVIRCLLDAYPSITRERIVGHSDVAPGRKTDPGPCFDWARLRRDLELVA